MTVAPDERLVGRRILVVDDTPANIELLAAILEPHGFNVLVATSGEAALRVAERAPPDLILLDVMMPGLDGFETCARLKQHPDLADVPVIFVTARDEPEDIVNGFRQGAVDYVAKPVRHEEVLVRVRAHVLLKALNDALQAKAAEAEALLHILCHDLQNSVGAARGFLGLIDAGQETPDARRLLGESRAALDRTGDIIDHVRELRALTAGKRALTLSPTPLLPCLESAAGLFRLRLEEKRLAIELPPAVPSLQVQVDEAPFVTCVLNNLVSNAIKFSRPGATIRFEAEPLGDEVRLTVADTGIGMSPALVADLFRTDRPTSRAGTDGEVGTGFGMPLVKHYVEQFGGRVTVDSRAEDEHPDDHGTRVSLYLKSALPRPA